MTEDDNTSPRAYSVLSQYSTGVSIRDIAKDLGMTPGAVRNWIYKHVKSTDYRKAKEDLVSHRTTEDRRIAAQTARLQAVYLDSLQEGLDSDDTGTRASALVTIGSMLRDLSHIGDVANRRADLNDGKATDRSENTEKFLPLTPEERDQLIKRSLEIGDAVDLT